MMENIKTDFSRVVKVSNLKLVILIVGIPVSLLPLLFIARFAPDLHKWSYNVTNGLINQTLVLYLSLYFVCIYLILNKSSKIKPIDLGLNKTKLKSGIILTITLFILLQVYGTAYSYISIGKLSMNEVMKEGTKIAGEYLSMIFGVALFEEVVFRGFLIPQIFIRLKLDKSKNKRMILALIISQAIFSVTHIPIRLVNGISLGMLMVSLVMIFIIGIVFAFIYLLTDNLFLAMGVHAVWDLSQNNLATFYYSDLSYVVVGVFAFIIMYLAAMKNSKRSRNITVEE